MSSLPQSDSSLANREGPANESGASVLLRLKWELIEALSGERSDGAPDRPAGPPAGLDSDPDVVGRLYANYRRWSEEGDGLPPEDEPAVGRGLLPGVLSRWGTRLSGGDPNPDRARLALPSVGDEVFGFRLWHVLGSGTFARVFLAEQTGLAGRPVVLKTSDLTGDEPRTLAQLQHTNIVPIYSVHEDPAAGLRAVCMPYFGGASLAAVIQVIWSKAGELNPGPRPARPTRPAVRTAPGADFLTALARVRAPSLAAVKVRHMCGLSTPVGQTGAGPPEGDAALPDDLRGQTAARTAAWVVARLADGLQHAHDRGILHRDVKPSNVLIAADGQPMLLDFNLSQSTAADPVHATLGGTIAYMAPEHLRAMRGRPDLARAVDRRSDVYSLGMVLFELLTGDVPFDPGASGFPLPLVVEATAAARERAAPSARAARPDVPWGLESIARKCLAPAPRDRYQQAGHLAEDLRRFLTDRPLRYAPELSWRERAGKWARRHPRLTSTASVAAAAVVLLALAAGALVGVQAHLAATRDHLAAVEGRDRMRRYEEGTVRALMLVNVNTDLQDPVRQGLAVCEDTLGLYQVLDRADWEDHPDWRRLAPADRDRLAADTRELLLSLAWARVRLAPGDPAAARAAAALVDRAEAIAGLPPSPGPWLDRALYLQKLGDEAGARAARDRAARLPPAGARDHYLLATALIRTGTPADRARAVAELDRSVRADPRFYWAWFQRGVCHLEGGEYPLAAADFGVCVGLWPEFAWGYFNLGCAHDRGGRAEAAVGYYTAALDRAPDFPDALLNRGLARLGAGRHADALADFSRAVGVRPDDPAVHAGRGLALEGLGRAGEADDTFRGAFARLANAPGPLRTRVRLGYGFAVSHRLPQAARDAFETVLRQAPDHPEALYGLAVVAAAGGDTAEAIGLLDRCIAAAPDAKDAALCRAVLVARTGRPEEAFPVIDRHLGRDPDDGAALYAGACVAALAAGRWAGTAPGQAAAGQAVDLLRRALAHGQLPARAARDPDLAAIRNRSEFRQLIGGATPAAP